MYMYILYIMYSAQLPQKQDECSIYAIMKNNVYVATDTLNHIMYSYHVYQPYIMCPSA